MKTVFTNGCFDILTDAHRRFLEESRRFGDRLVVGLNSDRSVRLLKGPERPVNDQETRERTLLELDAVDEVVIFDLLNPRLLLESLKPDVLTNGDYLANGIVGEDIVLGHGGHVVLLPKYPGPSTSDILRGQQEP